MMNYEYIINHMNKDNRPKKTRQISYKSQIIIYIDCHAPKIVTWKDIQIDLGIERPGTITTALNQLLKSQVIIRTKTGYKSILTKPPSTMDEVNHRVYDSMIPCIWTKERDDWFWRDISKVHAD